MNPDKNCVIIRIIHGFKKWAISQQEMQIHKEQLLMRQGIEAYMKEKNLKICKQCQQEKSTTLE